MSKATCYFFRIDGNFVRINFSDICYLEACKNYTNIVTAQRTYMTLMSMRQLEAELPAALFCRTHRYYIVLVEAVTAFNHTSVILGSTSVPLGPAFRSEMIQRLPVLLSDIRTKNNFMSFRIDDLISRDELQKN